jgi:hypothetical protein
VYTAKEKELEEIKRTAHGYIAFPLLSQKTRKEKAFFLVEFRLLVALSQPSRTPAKNQKVKRMDCDLPVGVFCALRLCAVLLCDLGYTV